MKIGIILATLLLFAGGVWYFQIKQEVNLYSSPTPTLNSENTSGIILEGANAINVNDQLPGLRVVVDLAILSKSGFVAIYKSNNGQIGDFMAASSLLEPGDNTDIIINARTSNETEYIAILHVDANNDRKFNLSIDVPFKDDNGEAILMEFMATYNTIER